MSCPQDSWRECPIGDIVREDIHEMKEDIKDIKKAIIPLKIKVYTGVGLILIIFGLLSRLL